MEHGRRHMTEDGTGAETCPGAEDQPGVLLLQGQPRGLSGSQHTVSNALEIAVGDQQTDLIRRESAGE